MSRLAWAVLLAGTALPAYEPVAVYDPARDAVGDIAAAREEARRSGRLTLVEVGGDWCGWCHRLDAFFEERPELRRAFEETFVTVKVNYGPENRNEEALGGLPAIESYPHYFVLGAGDEPPASQTLEEFERRGSYNEEKMRAFVAYWRARIEEADR